MVWPLGEIDAQVPGSVHQILHENGIIADPLTHAHALGMEWIDETDWLFKCRFSWAPENEWPRIVLRFDMLDAVATVTLNGVAVGCSDSMFVPQEFDIFDALIEGENVLEVQLASPVRTGVERRKEYFAREEVAWSTPMFDERAFLRKGQWMSGWDWGPRLVSCGIGGPIEVIAYENRLVHAQISSEPHEGGFRAWLEAEIEGEGEAQVIWADGSIGVEKFLEGPLWHPRGYGDPHLHEATIVFGEQRIPVRFGLRSIELRREPDEDGEAFEFVVNGVPIWCRGANIIPSSSFPHREDVQQLRESLTQFAEVHGNCLRVWGGGVYPSDAFFDICDELGILVWQDFMFACSHYPDSPSWQQVIFDEATAQIKRLGARPSLALWCGNNEIQQMFEQTWGGKENFPARAHGPILWEEVIPSALSARGICTPYISTSPTGTGPEIPASPDPNKSGCNAGNYGDQHFWEVWHGSGDWAAYRDSRARFSSEFGFASFAGVATWQAALGDDWDDDASKTILQTHNKTGKSLEQLRRLVELHYPTCESILDLALYSQCNQRDAMICALEAYRTHHFCRGALIWQWNDLWPAISWALRDFIGESKLAGVELQRLFHPLLFGADVRPEALEIRYAADGLATLPESVTVEFFDTFQRHCLGQTELKMPLAANQGPLQDARGIVGSLPWLHENASQEAAVIRHPEGRHLDRWAFRSEPKDMRFAEPLTEMCRNGLLHPAQWVLGEN